MTVTPKELRTANGSGSDGPSKWMPAISPARVDDSFESASYWSRELLAYADKMQRRADWWAIAAGLIAAMTSLAIWPTTDSKETWAVALVAAGAFTSAVCALMPRIKNYGEWAGKGREIATQYGSIVGPLWDLNIVMASDPAHVDNAAVRSLVDEFEKIRAAKNELRDRPAR
jgi:hypothetical protein